MACRCRAFSTSRKTSIRRKKYPMISYFYEELSDGLHSYVPPTGRNVINPTHYVSNGYLVFEPDIHYEIGYPGPSAMKSIVPGVQMLLQRGYVDPKGLGSAGPVVGRLSDRVHDHPDRPVQRRDGRRARGEHDQRLRRHPVGQWTGARRSSTRRPRAASASRSGTRQQLYIENSPLFWLDRGHDTALHHEQRCRRRGAMVPGHRDVRRDAATGEGGVPHRLQQ